MELSALANKLALTQSVGRHTQCHVCSSQELAVCDWDLLNDSSCEVPATAPDCDCCPRCLAKEGQSCGAVQIKTEYGHSLRMEGCETGYKCSSYVGEGVCVKLEGKLKIRLFFENKYPF